MVYYLAILLGVYLVFVMVKCSGILMAVDSDPQYKKEILQCCLYQKDGVLGCGVG
jgi:hypothetical protein